MMIDKLKNKNGFSSILFITLSLILVEMIAIFLILMYKTYAFNEIQGVMDITGINTLYKTLNEDYFRDEYVSIIDMEEENGSINLNENSSKTYEMSAKVKKKLMENYQKELNNYLKNAGDGEVIEDMTVTSMDASIEYSSWGTGGKQESKAQLMMDGVTEIKVNAHLNMDPLGGVTHVPIFTTHSSDVKNGGNMTYQIKDVQYQNNAGCYIIVVRSMVRLIIEN